MEVIQDTVADLWSKYQYACDHADERVKDWLFMDSYVPTLGLTMLYLLVVWGGIKFMETRQPVQLRALLIIYNFSLVCLNFHIFYELFTATWSAGYSYSCQPVSYTYDRQEYRILKALWWYYFSKLIEFLDTIFFILRKKNNQVSFLHVYHHASMFPIWWMGVKWAGGGQAFFGAQMNSFIHVLMYSYYGFACLGPQYQKYLWWKKYLTRIQLVQFVAGMAHAVNSIYVDCKFPKWMAWSLVVYGASILGLFLNFYLHEYIWQTRKTKPSQEVRKKDSNRLTQNGGAQREEAHSPKSKKSPGKSSKKKD